MNLLFLRFFAVIFTVAILNFNFNFDDNANVFANENNFNNNTLKVGVSEDNAYPYTYKQGGVFSGLDIDLINTIADELNLKTQITEMQFGNLTDALSNNEVDVVVSMVSQTPERLNKFALSNPYICTYGTFLFRNEKIKQNFESANRSNKTQIKIGIKKNTRYHTHVLHIFSHKNLQLQAYKDHNLVFGAFDAKKLDMILSENFLIQDYQNRHKSAGYVIGDNAFLEKLVIVASKNNANLINKINQVLNKMQNDGRLQKLSQKYLKSNLLCR